MRFKGIDGYKLEANPTPTEIRHIIMMGDSLSDRGTLNKTLLFGCIPMGTVSGLKGVSPDGRFTNGRVWSDHVCAEIANDFTIKRLQKKWRMDDTDISDAVIARESKVLNAIRDDYSLDDDRFVNYQGKVWVRSYCAGGLTSHDYSWTLSSSIIRFFTRLIVSTLAEMRQAIFDYDEKNKISYGQKEETLVIEWSGANDLVTVNAEPSIEEADKAIIARMDNIKKLIAKGYRNFMLVNLPNLSLTPRYQEKSLAEQENAQKCTVYFNEQLAKACTQLTAEYPHCSFDPFDINTLFEHVYKHPQKYMLDKDKLKTAYTTSKDFDDPSDGLSPSKGYMFYDDLHPTADVHAVLSAYFYDRLALKYELLEPNKPKMRTRPNMSEDMMLCCFRKHYKDKLERDQHGFFPSMRRSHLNYKEANLETILKHALQENGTRTLGILTKLGWLDTNGRIMINEPTLQKAMAAINVVKKQSTLTL